MLPGLEAEEPVSGDEHSEADGDCGLPSRGRLVRMRFLEAMHAPIHPFWAALLDKEMLCAGDAPCILGDIKWQRFRCRLSMEPLATASQTACWYQVDEPQSAALPQLSMSSLSEQKVMATDHVVLDRGRPPEVMIGREALVRVSTSLSFHPISTSSPY